MSSYQAEDCKKKRCIIIIPAIPRSGTLYEDIDTAFAQNPPVWTEMPVDYVEPRATPRDYSRLRLEPQRAKNVIKIENNGCQLKLDCFCNETTERYE